MVGAKWSQSANLSNDMCCTRTSIKDKLTKNKIDKTSENPLCRIC